MPELWVQISLIESSWCGSILIHIKMGVVARPLRCQSDKSAPHVGMKVSEEVLDDKASLRNRPFIIYQWRKSRLIRVRTGKRVAIYQLSEMSRVVTGLEVSIATNEVATIVNSNQRLPLETA